MAAAAVAKPISAMAANNGWLSNGNNNGVKTMAKSKMAYGGNVKMAMAESGKHHWKAMANGAYQYQ